MPAPEHDLVEAALTRVDILLCGIPIGLFLSILAVA